MDKRYPPNWKKEAIKAKEQAGWRCVRCHHPHEFPKARIACDIFCDLDRHPGGLNDGRQRVLTVHHLDGDKANLSWWNLTPLCQVCHLIIQAKVDLARPWLMLEHSKWFKPYVAGWYAFHYLGKQLSREEVVRDLDYYLNLERIK